MRPIANKIILLTGAAGGIGRALVDVLVQRGAAKIYVTDLKLANLTFLKEKYPSKVIAQELDVTNLSSVKACHDVCKDTDILINNAGVEFATRFIGEKSVKAASIEMAVNYHGIHNLCDVFWPSLLKRTNPSIVNMLSVASFTMIPQIAPYCASKAAAHTLTRSLRKESEDTPLRVYGVYPGYVDTAMTQNIEEVEKVTPEQIAIETCDGIENETLDIFPDKMAKQYSWLIDNVGPRSTSPLRKSSLFTPLERSADIERAAPTSKL